MNTGTAISPHVFGEVLFDHFPNGERVLGGAPFNVAWHLQALGDRPLLISRVGDDEPGREVLKAMQGWGMSLAGLQVDSEHPTGQVAVEIVDQEPLYRIVPDCAYDFIAAEELAPVTGVLYHGTLALRSQKSRQALERLLEGGGCKLFLDVNLRRPWWHHADVEGWLARASWVKLNKEELRLLGSPGDDLRKALAGFQNRFALEQVILTLGAAGALMRTAEGTFHQATAEAAPDFVDTVGAGDAFSAVYLHGLLAGWPIATTLAAAQKFAGRVVALRGATTADPTFYRSFITALPPLCHTEPLSP